MNSSNEKYKAVDKYIVCFPKELQEILVKISFTIKKTVPKAKNLKMKQANDHKDILTFHAQLAEMDRQICDDLFQEINKALPEAENKIWHVHPVWFLEGNPIVGYSKQKAGIRLMFWSGASFDEVGLIASSGKFKDASVFYNDISEINKKE